MTRLAPNPRGYDLTTLEGLAAAFDSGALQAGPQALVAGTPDGTFCPGCGESRRMSVLAIHWLDPLEKTVRFDDPNRLPAVFQLDCVQCRSQILMVIYRGPAGTDSVALPSGYGGLSTPHTPAAVAYYLDQAERSASIGARSAAVAMYRAALEQLLFGEGYTDRRLSKKISNFEEAPPAWARDLDPEFLRVIKDLGNAAIHPNDGDVEGQHAFEVRLLEEVRALFAEILEDAYERVHRRQERLASLQTAADSFRQSEAVERRREPRNEAPAVAPYLCLPA